MLGIGAPELVVIAVLFLIVFGPSKMPQMARDIGKFVSQARGAIDEFKDELTVEDETSNRPARNREEGSRRRKNARSEDEYPRDDQEDEDPDLEEDSGSTKRERAEYDL